MIQDSTETTTTGTVWGFDLDRLINKLQGWGEAIILKLPNFILAVIVFVLFYILAKYVSKFVKQILMRHVGQQSVKVMAGKTSFAVTALIGFFIALGIMDLDKVLTSVLAGAGVVGLAIGLALQGTLSNTFSGVLLSFLPQLQLGDWIESNGYAGSVEDINLRSVILKESDNNYVVIPNSKIVDSPFKNYTRTKRSRVFVNCGVGYECNLEEVRDLTLKILNDLFKQENGEEVEFFYQEFGDSSINFVARFWVDVAKKRDVLTAQNMAIIAIKKEFDARDINIPFPIRTLDFGKNKFRSETLTIANQQGSNDTGTTVETISE